MLRSEFDTLLKEKGSGCFPAPTDEEYRLIEFVYNYYPCNFDKGAVAGLYADFGMTIFYDMEARAREAMELEQSINDLRRRVQDLQDAIIKTQEQLTNLGDKRYIDND